MPASLTVVSQCCPSNDRLLQVDWDNLDLPEFNQVIKPTPEEWISEGLDDCGNFDIRRSRHITITRFLNGLGVPG